MAEATGVPISELTLGEAESFLNSLMCLPLPEKPNVEGKLLNCLKQLLSLLTYFQEVKRGRRVWLIKPKSL